MKTFAISTIAVSLLAALSSAAPASEHKTRDTEYVSVDFIGAADGRFTWSFPIGKYSSIGDPLSVSHISLSRPVHCTFYGVDGSVTEFTPPTTYLDVGPPQTQTSGICNY